MILNWLGRGSGKDYTQIHIKDKEIQQIVNDD